MSTRTIDRRQFLHATGATLAAPLTLRFATRSTPVGDAITLGLIGLGIRGRNLLNRYFLTDERVRVLGVCDVDRTRREAFKQRIDEHYENGDCATFVDYTELLERDDIDAVVIATPDHWHATQCIDAARAKKDIYCEKPLTHTLLEGKRIVDAVRASGVVFQTGSQQRTEFSQRFVQAVEYVRNGRIGELLSCNVGVGSPPRACDLEEEDLEPGLDWERWLGPAPLRPYSSVLSPRGEIRHYPQWRRYWEYSGGHLADMGAHHFDIVQWALDADTSGPVEVIPAREADDERGVTLVYANGVRVTHGGPSGATFVGTSGMIQVDRGRITAFPNKLFEAPIEEGEFKVPRHSSHGDDWIECIRSRKTPICDVEVGARSAAVCQLANLAYRYDEAFEWDPTRWTFAGGADQAGRLDYDRREGYELPGA